MSKPHARPWRVALLPALALLILLPACASSDESLPEDNDAARTSAGAATGGQATSVKPKDIASEVVAAMADQMKKPAVARATLAVAIVDAADGTVLFRSGADRPMVPASNMKLVTTAAALLRLGSEWRFRTFVGTLGDDLVIVGGGDPNLSGRFYSGDTVGAFRRWASVLKERGVTRIDGDLVFDDSLFESSAHHEDWSSGDRKEYFGAPIGALVANDSCIDVTLRGADRAGPPATVHLDPSTRYAPVRGTIRTRSPSKGLFSLDLQSDPRRLAISGHVPPKSQTDPLSRPVDDPGLFAATVIAETLEAEGIPIAGDVVRRRLWTDAWRMPSEFRCHIIHTSTLAQTISVANTNSQNLYAECLMKTVAAYGKSEDDRWPSAEGSWVAGGLALTGAMIDLGLEVEGCEFVDGSGLSTGNRVTARLLAGLLATMAGRDDADLFHGSLAGYNAKVGSLRNWPLAEPLVGRVRAKSGTLSKTRCLSGYVDTASGRRLAFSFLANNIRGHAIDIKVWMARTLIALSRL